jgi:hypothetical protein
MNAARLARRLQEAGDDRIRWAEAIFEEITDPSTGLVTKDYLDRRFAEFEVRFAQFETRFAQFETRFAELETKLTRGTIYAQVGGFIAIAVLILLK